MIHERDLQKLRSICSALPGVTVEPWYDHYRIAVRNKGFATQLNDHHGDGRIALVCKAAAGVQQTLVDLDPERFFVPPYVGPSGWVGLRLDRRIDWGGVRQLLEDGYALVAPKTLLAQLRPPPTKPERTPKPKGTARKARR